MSALINLYTLEKVFRFVLDTGLIPTSVFTSSLTKQTKSSQILQRNRNILAAILMLGSVHKMAVKCYEYQESQMMNGKFRHTPSAKWRNKFPIVLVHGYYGYGPDSSTMLGNYFEYALRTQVAKHFEEDLYIAVVSPAQGIHDRACELYQQLVGINNLRREWSLKPNDNGPNLIKAVYGPQHFYEDHQHQRIFKPRFLR